MKLNNAYYIYLGLFAGATYKWESQDIGNAKKQGMLTGMIK